MWSWDRNSPRLKGSLITALDVGSSKVSCAVAQLYDSGVFEVLGVGVQLSSGVKAGVVIDMDDVITSIVNAVHTAEKMAGVTVRDVILSVNGTHLKSSKFIMEMNVSGHPIDGADIRRALSQAREARMDHTFQNLHTFPTGYALDGMRGIRDPRGMFGDQLKVSAHCLRCKASPLYNLNACVEKSHLDVISYVAAPYASGLSCLVEDEMNLGAILVDMGGSTTSFAIFHGGQVSYAECLPIGGEHITKDIARCFSTTMSNAERLKTLYGSALPLVQDEREMIIVPQVGERRGDSANQLPRSSLIEIIKPRIEETFEYVKDRLQKAGINPQGGQRVVLTGGASQMAGAKEIGSMTLGKNIRLGRPLHLGSSELSQDPSFATCAGLLFYGQAEHLSYQQGIPESRSKKAMAKFGSVLKKIW